MDESFGKSNEELRRKNEGWGAGFMRKIYWVFYGILVAIVLITFIGVYGLLEIEEPSMADIDESIKDIVALNNVVKGDSKKLRQLYYINKSQVEDFTLFVPKTNMDANEILVIKAKGEDSIMELKEKLEARVKKQADTFKSYRPDLTKVIEDYKLKVNGEYIYLIISQDNKEITKAIDKNF